MNNSRDWQVCVRGLKSQCLGVYFGHSYSECAVGKSITLTQERGDSHCLTSLSFFSAFWPSPYYTNWRRASSDWSYNLERNFHLISSHSFAKPYEGPNDICAGTWKHALIFCIFTVKRCIRLSGARYLMVGLTRQYCSQLQIALKKHLLLDRDNLSHFAFSSH